MAMASREQPPFRNIPSHHSRCGKVAHEVLDVGKIPTLDWPRCSTPPETHMLNRRILAAAIASLGLAGSAYAQTTEVPREDRMEDRQADRQQDRREMEVENENENAREPRLAVPRKADGTVDLQALDAQIRAALAGGARDVRVQGRDLTAQERQQLADLAQ